ncbi:MAG: FMN-binding protein, partial [Oscillospiraceae bacterium]
FTAPKISALAIKSAAESRMVVLPGAKDFKEIKSDKYTYFEGKDAKGNTIGYVFTTDREDSSKGYGGVVTVMTGVSKDGKVTGIELLTLNETPGLGMNAKKPSFKDQFVGKSGVIGVSKTEKSDKEIQALTSATITSKAVTSAVNVALAHYAEIGGGK